MGWSVQIIGDELDLIELAKVLQSSDIQLIKKADAYFLKSARFDGLEADEVHTTASEIIMLVSGAAHLTLDARRPLEVAHVIFTNPDGTQLGFVYLNDSITVREHIAVVIHREDGSSEELQPADPVPSFLAVAHRNERAARVLKMLGSKPLQWTDLYHILEVIEEDTEGQVAQRGWATKAALTRFSRTANSPSAIGDAARHGRERSVPPENPMSLSEARSLIKAIVHAWLSSKIHDV